MQDEQGFINIQGVQLEYARLPGTLATAPTIVMLHEGLGSVAMWRDFPARLRESTGCHIVLYSRQSYGSSDPLPASRHPDYLEHEARSVLPALLERLGIERPVLLGHSDGASIALLYAADLTLPTARALVLMAPHVFVEDLTIAGIQRARQAYLEGELKIALSKYHRDVDNAFWRWSDVWLTPDFRGWNIERQLPAIDIPLLCIQGQQDEYGTLAQLESISKHCRGESRLVLLSDCRHSPHRDQPQATLQHISTFLG